MRTPAPAALRAAFTGSQPQAYHFFRVRRFAISKRSFFSFSKLLQNNDPTKAEESGWNHIIDGVIAPLKSEGKPQEVEEVAENANGPQTPSKPKDLSGYGSAAKRAGRHIKKSKELPPPHIPKWFFEENVVLREEGSERIKCHTVVPEISKSSQPNEPSTTPPIVSSDKTGGRDEPKSEEAIENQVGIDGSTAGQPVVKQPKVEKIEVNLAERKQSETEERNIQGSTAQTHDTKTKKDFSHAFYQLSGEYGTYGIDAGIMHEIFSIVATTLLAPSIDQVNSWISSKSDIVLYHPKSGGTYFLDALVQHLANVNAADLVRLDPQDIAEIGGSYLEESTDTHVKSLCSLGYDAYQAVSMGASQASEDHIEEDDADDFEEEDDRSRSKPTTLRSSISVIPIARFGGNIMDVLGSTLMNANAPSSPKSSPNVKVTADTAKDLKTLEFIETILNVSERKRGLKNATVGASYSAARESATRVTKEDANAIIDSANEAEILRDPDLDSGPTDHTPFIAAANDVKPLTGALIITIRDYMEINTTSSGGKILDKLHEIVRSRRKEGQRIIVIGTSTSKEFIPSISKSGFKSIEAEPENGPIRTIITPCRTQSSGSLDQNYKNRISNINFRNLKDMLRRLSPQPGEIDLLDQAKPTPIILQGEFCKKILPLDFIHRLATITLGMPKGEGKLDTSHVELACLTLSASEKAKYDWIDHEKEEENRNPTPLKKLVDVSGEDGLRFKSIGEGEERMKRLRKTCNAHEKKLLNGVVDPDRIRTTFADVRAPSETIDALKTLTSLSLVRPDAFTYGVLATDKIPGLLLYGPPGTGKTLLARAVAKESGATVLEVSGSDVYDMYVGEGEKNVKAIFTLAKKLTPCIVFIDEADAILGSRGGSNRTTHRELINQFLREWDGMHELSAFIMVATNRPFDLDEASLRRLPRRLLVDLPTEIDREAILKIHLKGEILDPSVSLATLASQTPFYSGSDLKNLAVAAALSCVREEFDHAAASSNSTDFPPYKYPEKRTLHPRHFSYAMGEISASISEDMGSLSAIRKFDEKFGDRKGRRKKRAAYGFETVKEGERSLSDAARVRNKV